MKPIFADSSWFSKQVSTVNSHSILMQYTKLIMFRSDLMEQISPLAFHFEKKIPQTKFLLTLINSENKFVALNTHSKWYLDSQSEAIFL